MALTYKVGYDCNLNTVLYYPLCIHLENTLASLNEYFTGTELDYGIIISEMLRELFAKPPKQYGRYGSGILASYQVQAPLDSEFTEEQLVFIFHETKKVLMDELSSYVIDLRFDGSLPYRYSSDDVVMIYLPVTDQVTDPIIRAHAVPLQAIRYFD